MVATGDELDIGDQTIVVEFVDFAGLVGEIPQPGNGVGRGINDLGQVAFYAEGETEETFEFLGGVFVASLATTPIDLLGDFDNDGGVGSGDLNLVLFNWNSDGGDLPVEWMNQRPPSGTIVGVDQLNDVLFNWGDGATVTPPEPASGTVGMIGAVAGVGFFRRRRRG